ncbi:MAG TPA: ABC transporter permease [Bacillota bacterium]|jgi:tungstate transport system permease protein|nr:ABC transporter permease [Bacillota bacterium]
MESIIQGFQGALSLIFSGDREVYSIIGLSLSVSLVSVVISMVISLPMGIAIGMKEFPLRKAVVMVINTLMGLPPVIAGLFVYLLLSRSGPLGYLGILHSPKAMIIAQVLLIIPIITGITMAAIKDRGRLIKNTAYTLGAGKIQMLWTLIREFRTSIGSSLIAGYGRAISEVGAVMLVGGNIKGYTRVMTTAIVLETNMGNFDQAIAIGIVLLALFFVINIFLQKFQGA